MRFLFIVKQKKNVDAFEGVIARLLAAGHDVLLGVQEVDHDRRDGLADRFSGTRFQLIACPEGRGDEWRASAPLVQPGGANQRQPAQAAPGVGAPTNPFNAPVGTAMPSLAPPAPTEQQTPPAPRALQPPQPDR